MSSNAGISENTAPHTDLADELAEFAVGIEIADLNAETLAAAKTNILDTIACALAGSSAPAVTDVLSLVQEWSGAPQAEVWVFGERYPAHHAAWANGVMAHARDYDDTHDAAILHAGVSTVPAAIAAGQMKGGISGATLIAAVVAGLEVTCRLGVAIDVDIVTSGFIYSSLLGYFGATAAAGRAVGLSADEMADAFGIVYSSVAGNHQVSRDASLMKRMQPALAAQAAVVAVQLARRGINGTRETFEGADGFFRVYLDNRVTPSKVRDGLGTRYEFLNLSYKPYPCCRDTHSAIDAALSLKDEISRPDRRIRRIRVGVTAPGYQMVCVPEAVRKAPKTIVQAQFSIPYTVAAACIDGCIGIGHFTNAGLEREDILELATKVEAYVDADIDRDWHRFVTPAFMMVEFEDGHTVERRIDYAKGHPSNPMQHTEFARKLNDCASHAARPITDTAVETLLSSVQALEEQPDLVGLFPGDA